MLCIRSLIICFTHSGVYMLTLCVCVYVCVLSHVQLFAILWTAACQASLSMGYFRQEYWNGLPFPPPRDLPDPAIELTSPVSPPLQTDSLPLEPPGKPVNPKLLIYYHQPKQHFQFARTICHHLTMFSLYLQKLKS